MIKSFRHKGLQKLYETGSHQGVRPDHAKRLRIILARLDASASHEDMNLPGLRLHPMHGKYDGFWAVSVTGNWRVIFKLKMETQLMSITSIIIKEEGYGYA